MAQEKRKCSICGTVQDTFLPFGTAARPNAQCCGCGSLERHRLLWVFLIQNKLIPAESLKLLHFAPEAVFHYIFSRMDGVEYWPVDFFPEKYRKSDFATAPVVKADITDIPFKDNWFDAILTIHVLEHIPDDTKALAELYRVMKPGGWAILQVPVSNELATLEDPAITTPEDRQKYYGQSDHVRMYGLDYKERLESAGFVVTVVPFANSFTEEQRTHLGLMAGEDIYFCRKAA